MRIAICEDDKTEARLLADLVQKQMVHLGVTSRTDVYFSAKDLLDVSTRYDLLLLDCRLGDGTGIDLARTLRDGGCDAAIIFVTAYDDYVYEGYEVNAFRYLLKPVDAIVLNRTLSDFVTYYEREKYLDFISGKRMIRLNLNEIMYIESSEKHSIVRHVGGIYETSVTIAELQARINSYAFFRTHRRFIVNMHYIMEIDKNIIRLTNDEKIEISRRNLVNFNKCYMNYLKYSMS
ncbi:MAG: response regulator transcription factor [Clostridia bacterium]|nr:response regulator transcription factor [Clostridia bacterium]